MKNNYYNGSNDGNDQSHYNFTLRNGKSVGSGQKIGVAVVVVEPGLNLGYMHLCFYIGLIIYCLLFLRKHNTSNKCLHRNR